MTNGPARRRRERNGELPDSTRRALGSKPRAETGLLHRQAPLDALRGITVTICGRQGTKLGDVSTGEHVVAGCCREQVELEGFSLLYLHARIFWPGGGLESRPALA